MLSLQGAATVRVCPGVYVVLPYAARTVCQRQSVESHFLFQLVLLSRRRDVREGDTEMAAGTGTFLVEPCVMSACFM